MKKGQHQEYLIGRTCITIGETTIAIDNALSEPDIPIPGAYKPFLTTRSPDIRVKLQLGLPSLDGSDKIFDSPPIWSLHRSKQKRVFSIFSHLLQRSHSLSLFQGQSHAEIHFAQEFARPLDPFCGPVLELLTIERLAESSGSLLHGCAIRAAGRGILFAGPSGVGKSTMLQLWSRQRDTLILSDDRTIARKFADRINIFGTPWHGKVRKGRPDSAKLDGIFFLKHGSGNHMRRIDTGSAVRHLLKSSFPPLWDARGMAAALEFFSSVGQQIPCYELMFVPDARVVDYLRRWMDEIKAR